MYLLSFAKNVFQKHFIQKEYAGIKGDLHSDSIIRQNANLLAITSIFTITFIALGFSAGTLSYIQKKLNNPYVLWLKLDIPLDRNKEFDRIKQQTEGSPFTVSSYAESSCSIYGKDTEKNPYKFRTFSTEDDILSVVLGQDNFVGKYREFEDEQLGVIVSQDMIEKLGYALADSLRALPWASPVYDSTATGGTSHQETALPICYVVKSLPDNCDFAMSEHTYEMMYHSLAKQQLDHRIYNYFDIVCFDEGKTLQVKQYLEQTIQKEWPGLVKVYNGGLGFPSVEVSLGDSLNYDLITTIFRKAKDVLQKKGMDIYEDYYKTYNYGFANDDSPGSREIKYDVLSVHFKSLDSIPVFENTFLAEVNKNIGDENKSPIQLEKEKVIEKQNFNYMQKLTKTTATSIIVLSIFSVLIFIYNLFKFHIESIRQNIGTFKSFGLSNNVFKQIYRGVVIKLVLTGILIAFVLALLIGYPLAFGLKVYLNLESGFIYYNLLSTWVLVAAVLSVFASIIAFNLIAGRFLNQTPSDLVNARLS